MPSPYPWWENLLWLRYHLRPSLELRSAVVAGPPSFNFAPDSPSALKVLLAGDLMSYYRERSPRASERVRALLGDADLFCANLEGPITRDHKTGRPLRNFYFDFSEDYLDESFSALNLRPDQIALNLANNHIGDFGPEAFARTCTWCHTRGISVSGLRRLDGRPAIVTRRGLRIGVWALSEWMNVDTFAPGEGVYRLEDQAQFRPTLWKERGEIDFALSIFHGDLEFRHWPGPRTREGMIELAHQGADVVAGHHSHVLGPTEMIDGKPIFYSLGNFVGIQWTWPTHLTTVAELRIGTTGPQRGHLLSYRLHPLFCEPTSEGPRLWTLNEFLERNPSTGRKAKALFAKLYPPKL